MNKLALFFILFPLILFSADSRLLVFMGPGGCPWSEKIQNDVLSKKEFISFLEGQVDIEKVDFSEQDLKLKYHVEDIPSFILIVEDNKIERIAYLAQTPEELAQRILTIRAFKKLISHLVLQALNTSDLKHLYQKADSLELQEDKSAIIEAGVKVEKGTFFHLIHYENLLKNHGTKNLKVLNMRERILARDKTPDMQFQVALFEFESKKRRTKKIKGPYDVIEPLEYYILSCKQKDKPNVWRAEMIIAEYLYSKNEKEEALFYAQSALKAAPENMRHRIEELISKN